VKSKALVRASLKSPADTRPIEEIRRITQIEIVLQG
jgi:hypothetical protein